MQSASNPLPYGKANITAVKFPEAFTDCAYGDYLGWQVLCTSTCCDAFLAFSHNTIACSGRLSDVAMVFLDRAFPNVLPFGFDAALDGNETIFTAGMGCQQPKSV